MILTYISNSATIIAVIMVAKQLEGEFNLVS